MKLDFNTEPTPPVHGLIVLQADETIEAELGRAFAAAGERLLVSRIPSGAELTNDSLAEMEAELPRAASLFPAGQALKSVGYGCTSASAHFGSDKVEALVRSAVTTRGVTDPLRAAIGAFRAGNLARVALVSPYIEEVNEPLRVAFRRGGIEMNVFGSFGISEEAQVARIDTASLVAAGTRLGQEAQVDAVFLSCTNLRTEAAIPRISGQIGKPVFSSNSVLARHMLEIGAYAPEN